MNGNCALTTVDNPYDPFTEFDSWFQFDIEKNYYSCSRLARVVELSDDMSEQEEDEAIERAIDEIVKNDFLNVYKKVKRKEQATATA